MGEGQRRNSVDEDELARAFEGSAPGANRFIITVGQPGVRIAFLERVPGSSDSRFRTAVTLHPVDAIDLERLLSEMLSHLKDQFRSDAPDSGKPDE